ncbi:TetR family transcriptional regulator [Micromonospora radicis]|uniref:TetR family transcriptional regulator n=1 Tax=Micromonospora radicis TaxID=1894971 RepID=A0A418N1H7_9ACTN|nr:TetR family transcriptional regulator [Micromonospora radicis]RIV41456.1 TetR family transcriptional regulator [Micromonospora radicis]
MTWAETDGTRSRILRAALDLFAEQGYQRTSLRQIAERLRLTKAAILYHFPSKAHLLTDLAEPLIRDLETLLDAAAALPPARARWMLVEGWADTMLRHRRSLGMLYHDLALVDRGSNYQRLVRIVLRANEIVAGPDAGVGERIRAVQALSACGDPVFFFTDVPDEVLRADILDGVRRLLADSPPAGHGADRAGPTPPTGGTPSDRRRPGRPPALGPEQVSAVRRMYAAGRHSVDEIAAAFGVSRATVYRHLESSDNNETVSS